MNCRQCGHRIRVNFGGYCSSTCRDFKPWPMKSLARYIPEEWVDAGSDESDFAPKVEQPWLGRKKLIEEFRALRGKDAGAA